MKSLALAGLPVLLVLAATMAAAQTAKPSMGDEGPAFVAGIAFGHDTYHYRFDNPSRFNTPDNVPHFFEQNSSVNAAWLRGRARYHFAGRAWETEAGVAPPVTGVGEDYDTFFNPDGNIILYGTTAGTSAFSFSVSQTVELGRFKGFHARVGYSYRRDRAEYHDSESTTTMTRPPSRTGFWNTGRETTISDVHEVRIGLSRRIGLTNRWQARLVTDLSPATLARLTTLLPDKYPGQPVVFIAKAVALDASIEVSCRRDSVAFGFITRYTGALNYSAANLFTRRGFHIGGHVGF